MLPEDNDLPNLNVDLTRSDPCNLAAAAVITQ